MSQLPIEIWALIIDHLAEDKGSSADEALAACSLVESRLIPLTRKHMFKMVRFRVQNPREADGRFEQLELRFPVITPYVRTLDVAYYSIDDRAGPIELARYMSLLAAVLGSRVDTLSLHHGKLPEHEHASMPLFTQAFSQLRHLRFDGVTFQSLDLVARHLASCPFLRTFKLVACYFKNVDLRQNYSLPPIQELKLILGSHLNQILSWATHSGLLPSLRHLEVLLIQEGNLEALAAFLSSPTLHLLGLRIKLGDFWQSLATHTWPALVSRSLTSLEISWGVIQSHYGEVLEDWPVARILENLPASRLETLTLEMIMEDLHPLAVPSIDGDALLPLRRFPDLKCLSVFFLDWREPDTRETRVHACASMKILVAAREKGVLRAYFSPEVDLQGDEPELKTYFDGTAYHQHV